MNVQMFGDNAVKIYESVQYKHDSPRNTKAMVL